MQVINIVTASFLNLFGHSDCDLRLYNSSHSAMSPYRNIASFRPSVEHGKRTVTRPLFGSGALCVQAKLIFCSFVKGCVLFAPATIPSKPLRFIVATQYRGGGQVGCHDVFNWGLRHIPWS